MRGFVPAVGDAEKILQRKVTDAIKATCGSGIPRYTGFLNEREQELASACLNRERCDTFLYGGGYEGAERCMLCVFEDKSDIDFPMSVVRLEVGIAGAKLTHRDYLGSILGCGIRRDCVGDILTDETGAVAFVQNNILSHLERELVRVANLPVLIKVNDKVTLPEAEQPDRCVTSVASLRLDTVLAAVLGMSRTKATALITGGRVQVNHLLVEAIHYMLAEKDLLSVRGIGRFLIEDVGGKSKKNRTFIEYLKY